MPTDTKHMTVEEFEKQQRELREKFESDAKDRLGELEAELAPRLQERDQIRAALGLVDKPKPSPSGGTSTGGKRRGRKGTREEQAVKVIADNPGITVSEIGRQMGVKPNYLYRVVAGAEEKGRIAKEGKGYRVA